MLLIALGYKKYTTMDFPKGYLVAIRGAEDKGEEKAEGIENSLDSLENSILKTVVALMKTNEPYIEIITTAAINQAKEAPV